MRIFGNGPRDVYKRQILLYLTVMILFPGVQAICRVTLSPVLSVMQIITFFMVIFWIGDFLRFRGRHRQLEQDVYKRQI